MLDKALIRERPDDVRRTLRRRGLDAGAVDEVLALDERRRAAVTEIDALKAERNRLSESFARAKAAGDDELQRLRAASGELGARIKSLEALSGGLDAELDTALAGLPNILDDEVPDGPDESANKVLRTHGAAPIFDFQAKAHWELGERLGIIDFEAGSRIAGSRFAVLRGPAARLSRALAQFFLDRNVAAGFEEVNPPVLVNRESVGATGHLSKFADAMFQIVDRDGDHPTLYLSPTSEVQLVNLHRDRILEGDALPLRYTAHTLCFRQEAGAAGKDTRGLIRQHQFEKVELVVVCRPDESAAEHARIVGQAEALLQALELPYRVSLLSSGDTGFASRKTYDLEVWLPGQNAYREISSCSNTGDFQTRRAGIRFRREPRSKPEFAHALNGSGLAVGRALVAVFENFQDERGGVTVPPVLRPYMGGLERIG